MFPNNSTQSGSRSIQNGVVLATADDVAALGARIESIEERLGEFFAGVQRQLELISSNNSAAARGNVLYIYKLYCVEVVDLGLIRKLGYVFYLVIFFFF